MRLRMEEKNLKHLRCGECGNKAFENLDVKNKLAIAWHDFPKAYLTKSLVLPVCQKCGNHAQTAGDAARIDEAMESSVKDQVKQFIDVIKTKAHVTSAKLASTVGVTPEFISLLVNQKRIPSFQIWNELRLIAQDPVNRIKEMDPELDVRDQNILLRA